MLDGSGGVFLTLLTESYAVRALLGSLAAVGLATLAVSTGMVRSGLARRLLILGPVLTAVAASITAVRANAGFLPSVGWGGSAPSLSFEALQGLTAAGLGVDLLLVLYGTVVGTLVLRRVFGMVTVRRVLARASRPARNSGLMRMTRKLSRKMGIPTPQVLLLRRCPGGAFTVGTLHPIVAVDPQLLRQLDDRELEGLLAHELAHIRRRDNLLWLGVGIARDLSFFLPPMHLAARWLRLEQEESADELAS
ncbi:MAG TPA: M56 family metallopeptidase, partial [Egibacteraceae bacterium]|nr:M56 family metallopeptidase [Egibacteraceae bacterium]